MRIHYNYTCSCDKQKEGEIKFWRVINFCFNLLAPRNALLVFSKSSFSEFLIIGDPLYVICSLKVIIKVRDT